MKKKIVLRNKTPCCNVLGYFREFTLQNQPDNFLENRVFGGVDKRVDATVTEYQHAGVWYNRVTLLVKQTKPKGRNAQQKYTHNVEHVLSHFNLSPVYFCPDVIVFSWWIVFPRVVRL